MKKLSNLSTFITLVLVLFATLTSLSQAVHDETDRPIIANLLADPIDFDGKGVVIYGLVIKAFSDGRIFLLQDVSQMPLKVIGDNGINAKVGDQLLVHGVFRHDEQPYLRASRIIPTKVLGGGGCC
ncbi:MAG: hypothetical protein OES46_04985 [Gammaproteobacteria bacterium]|nr:hypothetical protein [Gammaproteobacteria bacterium]